MKHTFTLIIVLLLVIISCKSSLQKNIIGRWKGQGTETSMAGGKESKFIISFEFIEGGQVTETKFDITNENPYPPLIYAYDIEGDSIIWINNIGNKMLIKSHIESLSATKLVYKTAFGETATVYDLSRVTK